MSNETEGGVIQGTLAPGEDHAIARGTASAGRWLDGHTDGGLVVRDGYIAAYKSPDGPIYTQRALLTRSPSAAPGMRE